MADPSRYVTDSGGIRAALLGTTVAGTFVLAWINGVIRTITRWGTGVTSSIQSVGDWGQGVIYLLFLPAEIGFGFDSPAAFVEAFGLAGQAVAGVYVVLLLVFAFKLLSWLAGVLYAAAGGG